jgi:hypothetical protein
MYFTLDCLQPDAHYSKSVKNNTVDGRNVSNGGCIPPPHFWPRLPHDAEMEHAQRHGFSLRASSLSLSHVSPFACSTGHHSHPPAPRASGRSSNTSSFPEKPHPRRWLWPPKKLWPPPTERSSSGGRGIRHQSRCRRRPPDLHHAIFPHAGGKR